MNADELLLKLMGIKETPEQLKEKRTEDCMNYMHLLDTMNETEFALEIAKHFGGDFHQAAILGMLYVKIRLLEKGSAQ